MIIFNKYNNKMTKHNIPIRAVNNKRRLLTQENKLFLKSLKLKLKSHV